MQRIREDSLSCLNPGYAYIFARNFLLLSRGDQFLPILQVDVCYYTGN